MCQLQFLMRMNAHLTPEDILQFFNLMSQGNIGNSDAFGIFNSRLSLKKKGMFKPYKVRADGLLQDTFLVGHNRKATNGDPKNNQNNHPFELNGFLLVHNGMVHNHKALREAHNIPEKPETDSYVILWIINHFFRKSKANSRHKRLLRAIKKTCSNLDGWYSVFLLDKASGNLYYFRNRHARFVFALFGNEVIAGTTEPENLRHIYTRQQSIFKVPSFRSVAIAEPEPEAIYLINEKVGIEKAGEFKDGDDAVLDMEGLGGWGEKADDFLVYEQCVADWVNDCLGYCPEIEVTDKGLVRIRADEGVQANIDFLCSSYSLKNGWYEIEIECLYGLDEYLCDWH